MYSHPVFLLVKYTEVYSALFALIGLVQFDSVLAKQRNMTLKNEITPTKYANRDITVHKVSICGEGKARDGMQQVNKRNAVHKLNYNKSTETKEYICSRMHSDNLMVSLYRFA